MQKRVFGSEQYGDIMFSTSLTILQRILDFVLAEMYSPLEQGKQKRVFKLGFFASNVMNTLAVLVEVFENDQVY
jgi:hypothetical protein